MDLFDHRPRKYSEACTSRIRILTLDVHVMRYPFLYSQTLAALTGILESVAERRRKSPPTGDASTSSSGSGGATTPPPSPSQNTDNEDSNHGERASGINGSELALHEKARQFEETGNGDDEFG